MSRSKRRRKATQRGARATASAVANAPRSSLLDKPSSGADSTDPAIESHDAASIPWFAKPPARNVPLLILSIVLLAVWLILLIWLALTVRGQRDTVKGAEGSVSVPATFDEPFSCQAVY